MNLRLKLFLTIGIFTSLTVVHAASFDCAKASAPTEKMICQNPKISKLDDRLSEVYKEVRKADASVVEEQKSWLKEARACKDEKCLENAYGIRVEELENRLAKLSQPSSQPAPPKASTSDQEKYFQIGVCYQSAMIATKKNIDSKYISPLIPRLDAIHAEQMKIIRDVCGQTITESCMKRVPPKAEAYGQGAGRAEVELTSPAPIRLISGGAPGNSPAAISQTLRAFCGPNF